ncbi:MAG: DUF1127 domain-containing protein [Amylibacter sp.]
MAYIETNRSPALTAALSENRTKATAGITGLFVKIKSVFEAAKLRQNLRHMPPHLLRDIGFSEGDISVLHAESEIGRPENIESLRLMR